MKPLSLGLEIERWPLVSTFRITGHAWSDVDVLVVRVTHDGRTGVGEAAGVYYKADTPLRMRDQLERYRRRIEEGLSREELRSLLPPGGARNALDCALWDLEAKTSGRKVWEIAGLARPQPLLTTFTCGADEPRRMAEVAKAYAGARAIKVKLTGDLQDGARVVAVREAVPDVWLSVDGNQGFTPATFEKLLPVLVGARVALVEQPFPIGKESWIDSLHSPLPFAADESAQSLVDIQGLVGRFQVVNIKLDKCGGLTEALAIARAAMDSGLQCMVGNMIGTSLAMAPAYLVGQLCTVVDLDGPILLRSDRKHRVVYSDGYIDCPSAVWGAAAAEDFRH